MQYTHHTFGNTGELEPRILMPTSLMSNNFHEREGQQIKDTTFFLFLFFVPSGQLK